MAELSDEELQPTADYLNALYWTLPYDEWVAEGVRVVRQLTGKDDG